MFHFSVLENLSDCGNEPFLGGPPCVRESTFSQKPGPSWSSVILYASFPGSRSFYFCGPGRTGGNEKTLMLLASSCDAPYFEAFKLEDWTSSASSAMSNPLSLLPLDILNLFPSDTTCVESVMSPASGLYIR